jgi:hypothetical protein
MNKILIVALITLTISFSFSQENKLKLGTRTELNLYNVFWEGKPPGVGKGFGCGIVSVFPITSSLAFNPEFNFIYRNLYNHELDSEKLGTMKESMKELALDASLLFQFMPFKPPFYFDGGFQFSIPFSTKLTRSHKMTNRGPVPEEETKKYGSRPIADLGIALGFGHYITRNLAIDVRGVVGLTNISTEEDIYPPVKPFGGLNKTWLIQYGLGLNYFL